MFKQLQKRTLSAFRLMSSVKVPYELVDIGANLGHASFSKDYDEVLERAKQGGISKIMITGTCEKSTQNASEMVKKDPSFLYFTAGVHPHDAKDFKVAETTQFLRSHLEGNSSCVAVGECGLDFNRNFSPRENQLLAFEKQVELACELKKPLFIHEREAHKEMVEILTKFSSVLPPTVIHCFTGTAEEARKYIEMGLYIGLTGFLWKDKSEKGVQYALKNGAIPVRAKLTKGALELQKFGSFDRNEPCTLPATCELIAAFMDESPEDEETAKALCDIIKASELQYDYIVGVPYGAIMLATLVSSYLDKPMLLKRKEAKGHGKKLMIEGRYEAGKKALVIEDVVTSGASVLETVEELRKVDLLCDTVLCVLDREQGGVDKLRTEDITLHSVISMTKILEFLVKQKEITEDRKIEIQKMLKNPNEDKVYSATVTTAKIMGLQKSSKTHHPDVVLFVRLPMAIPRINGTNLCLAADCETTEEVLSLVKKTKDYICALKIHYDTIQGFDQKFLTELHQLANDHEFVIFEDRKYADTGKTMEMQLQGGSFPVAEWADLVTVHSVAGSASVKALKSVISKEGSKLMGCLLIAELSTENALTKLDGYVEETVRIATENSRLVSGFICQKRCHDDPSFLYWTPGVNLSCTEDGLGQQWRTVEQAVAVDGCDIIIVGRGISAASDVIASVLHVVPLHRFMIFDWLIPSYMISVSFCRFLSYLFGKMQNTLNADMKALKDEHKHQKVVDMFPNLLLDQLIEEYEHISSEALVEIVLQNMPNIETKPKIPGYCHRLRSMLGVIVNILPCEAVKTHLTRFLAVNETVKMPDLRERMECTVCLDNFLVEDMVFCDRGASTAATHSFCRLCLEQHAKAATEDMPLARGGTGLKCMTFDCKNPIIFHEIQYFVTSEMAQRLGDRILEESVAQAGLNYLDRCRKCNCGVEMNAPASVVPRFRCPNCKYEFCRSCERQWLGHYGKSCEKMALLEKKEGAMRLLEKRLSEAIVRKCPKCSLAFVKDGGCNMMKCRCGTTQCYICRENNIHYSHFCSHARTPNKGCDKCDKSCTQWEDPSIRDRQTMEAIKRGQQDQQAVPTTSKSQVVPKTNRFYFF
uniref:Uridine 5'-monophosphate synthase n=1 Tax=Ditylenchus dipsaci TaxID=166011 RepID=A0A915D799_9BILA